MGRPINNLRKSATVIKINKQGAKLLVGLANTVVLRMTGNANFSTPVPALTVLTSASNDVRDAFIFQSQKRNRGSKGDTLDFQNKVVTLRNTLLSLLQYVRNTALIAAAGDTPFYDSVIASSGYGVIPPRRKAKIQQLPRMRAQSNNKLHPGNAGRISWRRPIGDIKGTKLPVYNVYQHIAGVWTLIGSTTKTNFTFTGNTQGVNVDFKIVPFNSQGEGQAIFTTIKGLS